MPTIRIHSVAMEIAITNIAMADSFDSDVANTVCKQLGYARFRN